VEVGAVRATGGGVAGAAVTAGAAGVGVGSANKEAEKPHPAPRAIRRIAARARVQREGTWFMS
jgi:hypothetical protein